MTPHGSILSSGLFCVSRFSSHFLKACQYEDAKIQECMWISNPIMPSGSEFIVTLPQNEQQKMIKVRSQGTNVTKGL